MRGRGALAIGGMVLLAAPAAARTVTDEQVWSSVIATKPLPGGFQAQLQVQNRMTNHAQNRAALMMRGTIQYTLDQRWSLQASYAHTDMPLEPNARRSENSAYQQIGLALGRAAGGALSTRVRMEERWREGRAKTGWRVRSELRWVKPLTSRPGGTNLVLWEEPVVELKRTDFGQTAGDLQFRSYAGFSIPVARGLRIDPGYVNIYGRRQRAANLFYHVAQLTLNWRI